MLLFNHQSGVDEEIELIELKELKFFDCYFVVLILLSFKTLRLLISTVKPLSNPCHLKTPMHILVGLIIGIPRTISHKLLNNTPMMRPRYVGDSLCVNPRFIISYLSLCRSRPPFCLYYGLEIIKSRFSSRSYL